MTAVQELVYASIAEVSEKVKRREVSPVELTDLMLARIEQLDPKLHSYYTVLKDEVRAAARQAEAEIRRGQHRGPLHGIPIGIKDIYESGRTTCGSKPLVGICRGERLHRG